MSHSADADDFIVHAWRDALADAQVDEDDYHLIVCPGAAVTGYAKAVSFPKGTSLHGDPDEGGIVISDDKLAEGNDEHIRWLHRVATVEDWDEDDPVELARLAGLLRHEIEHGRQREVCLSAFSLYDLTNAVIGRLVHDGENYRSIVHMQPIEWDADAAASQFLRGHPTHEAAVDALLGDPDTYLVRARLHPEDPHTLVVRTVAFLYSLRSGCEAQAALEGTPFDAILDHLLPGAGELWRRLETADRLCFA